MTERALTRAQLADALGVSESTIDRRHRAGMPSFTVGARSPRFYLSECVEWLTHNARSERQDSGIGISAVLWSSPPAGQDGARSTEGRDDGQT